MISYKYKQGILNRGIHNKHKRKKVATLERYISVPKLFLALPFFTPKNSAATEKYIEVAKFSDLKNIKLRSVNLSVIRDFEVFLFLMKKAYQKNQIHLNSII